MCNRHTFGVFLSNGQRKQGLVKSFLRVMFVHVGEPTIRLEDDTVWTLYKENDMMMLAQPTEKAIVSFQVYDDGETFAVARRYDASKVRA